MKYKVGDKVKVRSDLEIGKKYGKHVYVKPMDNLKGRTVTIMVFGGYGYRIEELGYTWTDEMFEEVENKMIKISNWKDLHEIKNDEYHIKVELLNYDKLIKIEIRTLDGSVKINIYSDQPTEIILYVLKGYGFGIEFQEEPTLTEEEFIFLNCIEFPECKRIYKASENSVIMEIFDRSFGLKQDLFQFIKTGESWKMEYLLKLKRKGE